MGSYVAPVSPNYFQPGFNQFSYTNYPGNYGPFAPTPQPAFFQPYLNSQNNAYQPLQNQKPYDYFMRGALTAVGGLLGTIGLFPLINPSRFPKATKEGRIFIPSRFSTIRSLLIAEAISLGGTWAAIKAYRFMAHQPSVQNSININPVTSQPIG